MPEVAPLTRRPVLLAHRGSETERPENTLEAFSWALDHGADWIETDVHATADGHLVCLHDPTLDRTTSGRGPVSSRTLEDVTRLGVLPLADAVEAFPDVRWNVDMKPDRPEIAALMTRFISHRRAEDRWRVASFSGRTIRAFRALTGGTVRTAAARDEVASAWLCCRGRLPLRRPPYDALQIPVRHGRLVLVDRRMVAAAHRAGVEVHVWTVDDPEEARRLLAVGVDGLITNRVDLLRGLSAERP